MISPQAIGSQWTGPVIELKELCRTFGATHAVDHVSFEVPRGSVFGYIGPNGAGKTTSMRILATLELPTSGQALVEGLSSVNDPDRVRARLGFMPDSFGTYSDTNCAEYLDFFARSHGLVGRERTRRLRWVMDFTGLRALAYKPIRGLSKGMRQRLCLGRALIHDPGVLILDEPAAGLDPRARIELRKIIRTLAAEDKTILVSSHILTELAEMCDRIGILEQGRLLATGTVDEIRKTLKRSRDIVVEIAGSLDPAMKLLGSLDAVQDLRREEDQIHFAVDGGDETQILVLRALCDAHPCAGVFLARRIARGCLSSDYAGACAMNDASERSVPESPAVALESDALSLGGGQSDEIDYHPLARDSDGVGGWGWIDHCGERLADWLNPILIKEARQSLKSRQFIVTFFLLLAASCVWTILGVVVNAPDVYYVPTGESLLAGYYFVLAIPLVGMVPLAAHRSLAAEIDDDTFEMLVITQLSSMRIVMGKLNSAMLQMMVYFAAIVPCLAFSYLLRGVNLPTIAMLIGIVFFTALLITSFALMLATLAPHRAGQTLALLGVLAVIFFAEITCAAFCLDGVLNGNMGAETESIMFTILFIIVGASCIVVFIKAAAARIAPVTENKSTGLRWCMFTQQLLWIATIAYLVLWYRDLEVLNFGVMVVGGYWLVMGTLMLSESPELSPRVQRGLPSTLAGRTLMTWFNPGPGTGYVFAIASGSVAAVMMGGFGLLAESDRAPRTDPATFATIIIGYLLAYLGIIRLLVMPLCHRFGRLLSIPIGTAVGVMAIGGILPTILSVVFTGSPPFSYTPLETMDWAWTLVEAFESRYSPLLAMLILVTGIVLTMINFAFLFRDFRYRRISVPERVLEDQHGLS